MMILPVAKRQGWERREAVAEGLQRRGRKRRNHLNAVPIQIIHDRWIGPRAAAASARLARFKKKVEVT